jgi:hypothetical protein
MSRQDAHDYVQERRNCVIPNTGFWKQLETYEGILNARYLQCLWGYWGYHLECVRSVYLWSIIRATKVIVQT